MDLHWISDPNVWLSVLTLTVLEIVLGIDNVVFIAILAGRLPLPRQARARQVGLSLALITRLGLLASIVWIIGLTRPLFEVFGHQISWRDLILIAGGLFLLYKGTREIHHALEADTAQGSPTPSRANFASVVIQIALIDILFSIDNVITAVGVANEFWAMAAAIVIAVAIMLAAAGPLTAFLQQHPTVKMLALSFLLLIGMTLVADGVGFNVPKGYVYAAIGFSVIVEILNQRARRRGKSQPRTQS